MANTSIFFIKLFNWLSKNIYIQMHFKKDDVKNLRYFEAFKRKNLFVTVKRKLILLGFGLKQTHLEAFQRFTNTPFSYPYYYRFSLV